MMAKQKTKGEAQDVDLGRPTPFAESEGYVMRVASEQETEMHKSKVSTTTNLSKASTEEEKAQIRALKRAKGEVEKRKRIEAVKKQLQLGGGGGAKIRSSLMGIGGQDREKPKLDRMMITGNDPNELDLTLEGTQHTDISYNHTLVNPELQRCEQRMFHRPRLLKSASSPYRRWMMCAAASNKKKSYKTGRFNDDGSVFVNASTQGGGGEERGGSEKKLNITKESQLAITSLAPDESLVALEYTEERPPLCLNKGMVSNIINYYNGPLQTCPISAGGGDRPPDKLNLSRALSIPTDAGEMNAIFNSNTSFLGPSDKGAIKQQMKLRKELKRQAKEKRKAERRQFLETNDIMPEGVTNLGRGCFLASVGPGETQTALVNNLYVAPLFQHSPPPTDFLLTFHKPTNIHMSKDSFDEFAHVTALQPPPTSLKRREEDFKVIVQPFPKSFYVVGQTEPKTRVPYPNSKDLRTFQSHFIQYQVGKELERVSNDDDDTLEFSFIKDTMFKNSDFNANQLKLELKEIAYEKEENQFMLNRDDFPGVEKLGRNFTPEQVAAHESHQANIRRLHDLGIKHLYNNRDILPQVTAAIEFMDASYQTRRQRLKVLKRRKNTSAASKDVNKAAMGHYEECVKAVKHLTEKLEEERRQIAIARFILEELSTTTWQLTNDLIDIHGRAGGAGSGGICTLMGYGDPSGRGEAMSFLREPENKAMHSTVASGATPNAGEKLVGTDKDLRRLSMNQLGSMLRSYGTNQEYIDTLKRWDRVHLVRDLATRVTSDGLANDNQLKYARGEKLKASEQREVYRERIQQIWERQKEALSNNVDLTAELEAIEEELEEEEEEELDPEEESKFHDDLLDMVGGTQDVGLLAGGGEGASTGIFGNSGEAKMREINRNKQDAADLQALRNELAEDRQEKKSLEGVTAQQLNQNKKGPKKYVVRRKIITTYPDGTQTTSFKFIVEPENRATPNYLRLVRERTAQRRELGLKEAKRKERKRRNELAAESEAAKAEASAAADGTKAGNSNNKIFGHAMYADEDVEYEEAMKINIFRQGRMKNNALRFSTGNLKERLARRPGRKPKEEDDYENWTTTKTTSEHRAKKRQRGDNPNVQLNRKLESVLGQLEGRPESVPFRRGVDNKLFPDYKSKIKKPMDIKRIRDRCKSTAYRRVQDFLADMSLIYENSAAYNGMHNDFTNAARSLFQMACNYVESEKEAFEILEGMVSRQQNKKGRLSKEQQDAEDAFERQEQARLQAQEARKALVQAPQSKIGLLTDLINDDDDDSSDDDDHDA